MGGDGGQGQTPTTVDTLLAWNGRGPSFQVMHDNSFDRLRQAKISCLPI